MAELCTGIKGLKEDWRAYSLDEQTQTPISQRSVVSFVDILGYSAKVREAAKQGKTDVFLHDIRQALFAASAFLEREAPCYAFTFTDSVVVGWPITENGDSEVPLCISCWNLAIYQLTMSQFNLFVRGGVAVGEAYFDEYVQSGEAFLDAYEVEEHQAIYPRIVLSEEAIAEAQASCGYYTSKDCPLNYLFAVDADGAIFVNYLSSLFEIFDVEKGRRDIEDCIIEHRDAIERNLKATAGNPHIYRKYQWAAKYHDFFCESISQWLGADFGIRADYDAERFSSPRHLLDVFPDWLV